MHTVRTVSLLLIAASACTASMTERSDDRAGEDGSGGTSEPGAPGPSRPWGGTGAGTGAGGASSPAPIEPGPGGVLRLTREQVRGSLRELFGAAVPLPADLEADVQVLGFSTVGARSASVSARSAELYETAARAATAWAFGAGGKLRGQVTCARTSAPDEACARTFLRTFGRRVFRRPLADGDEAPFLAAFRRANDGWLGLEVAISAMLQSPRFHFRFELGEPDPEAPGRRRFDAWQMASRLAFFLWNRTPDDALLDAAERGVLTTAQGLRAEAERLIADARVREGLGTFLREKLELQAIELIAKDSATYPAFGPSLQAAMQQETQRVIDDVAFERDAAYADLLDTRTTFVTKELAALYGLGDMGGATPTKAVLPANGKRLGVLGHAGFLASRAHPAQTSPTMRGKFVQERVLCNVIPAPPADVNVELPAPDPSLRTLRQRLTAHREVPACAGCHALMDPIGLAFEHFDALGALRERDGGEPIDASGELDGRRYDDLPGLARVLREHPNTAPCVVRDLFRYAHGRAEVDGEAPLLEALLAAYQREGGRVKALALALVTHDAFLRASAPQ